MFTIHGHPSEFCQASQRTNLSLRENLFCTKISVTTTAAPQGAILWQVNEHPNFILTVMHPPAFTPKLLHMINYSSPTLFLTESELTTLCVILTKCCSAVLKSVYRIQGNIHGERISFFSFSVYQNEMKCTRFFICKMDRTKIKHTNQLMIAQNEIWTRRKFPAIQQSVWCGRNIKLASQGK